MKHVVIVGLGGIGSALLEPLIRFLNYSDDVEKEVVVTLVEGDDFENKNMTRQRCTGDDIGRPKVDVMIDIARKIAPNLRLVSIPAYIQESNVSSIIREDSAVFICVDNHPTRMLIAKHCDTLNNCIVVSGGNEYSDGNAQIFIRKNGERITARLDEWHPEIGTDNEGHPLDEKLESCEAQASSSPQLVFANFFAAASMLMLFYHHIVSLHEEDKQSKLGEVFFDLVIGAVSAVERPTLGLE